MSAHAPDPAPGHDPDRTLTGELESARETLGPGLAVPRTQPSTEPSALVAGVVVGDRYRLDGRLGAGGMGEAWEATHVVIGKRVALKLLSMAEGGGDSQAQAERMLREATIVGGIEHRNVVKVVDYGHTAGGTPFFVMELLRGRSLAEICRTEAPLAWPRARNLIAQIADGLGAAHDHGIIHRDVKPDNVLVVQQESEEVAKVIDFGIAKSIELDAEARRLTRTGAICGTPAFMSPEQIRGDPVDERTDVYSLGCLAYELLVGHRPFPSGDVYQMMYAHLYCEPDPLPETVPGAFAEVIERCLLKDPEARYPSMAELREALLAVDGSQGRMTVRADHLTVGLPGAQRELEPRPTTAPARPRRGLAMVVGGLAAAAVVLAVAVPWGSDDGPEPAPSSAPARVEPEPAPIEVANPTTPVADDGESPTSEPEAALEASTGGSGIASSDAAGTDAETAGDEGPEEEAASEPTPPRRTNTKKKPRRPPPSEEPTEPVSPKKPKRRPDGTFDVFGD